MFSNVLDCRQLVIDTCNTYSIRFTNTHTAKTLKLMKGDAFNNGLSNGQ